MKSSENPYFFSRLIMKVSPRVPQAHVHIVDLFCHKILTFEQIFEWVVSLRHGGQCFSSLTALRLKRSKTLLKWISAIIYLRFPVLASKGKPRKLVTFINSPSILLSDVINMDLVPNWKLPTVHYASNRHRESSCSFYRQLSPIFRDTSSILKLLFVSKFPEEFSCSLNSGTTSSTRFNRTSFKTMFLETGILDKFHFHPFKITSQFNSSVRE